MSNANAPVSVQQDNRVNHSEQEAARQRFEESKGLARLLTVVAIVLIFGGFAVAFAFFALSVKSDELQLSNMVFGIGITFVGIVLGVAVQTIQAMRRR